MPEISIKQDLLELDARSREMLASRFAGALSALAQQSGLDLSESAIRSAFTDPASTITIPRITVERAASVIIIIIIVRTVGEEAVAGGLRPLDIRLRTP
jgi:hypothetical protein